LVIGEDGPLGKMSAKAANIEASKRGLDLVKISPNAKPPVCKIMDYGKFCFERKKKEKEAKKKQHVVELKELRLSVNIDGGDLETKANQARKFISNGNKVKISIKLKGRQIQHPELGFVVINRFCDLCNEFATPEGKSVREGKNMFVVLGKKKIEDQKSQDQNVVVSKSSENKENSSPVVNDSKQSVENSEVGIPN